MIHVDLSKIPREFLVDNDYLDQLEETVADDPTTKVDDRLEKEYLFKQCLKLIDTVITARERQLLCLLYGLYGEDPHSPQEVAELLGISYSAVRTTAWRAIQKLRLKALDIER